jgi:hypothetical protein
MVYATENETHLYVLFLQFTTQKTADPQGNSSDVWTFSKAFRAAAWKVQIFNDFLH